MDKNILLIENEPNILESASSYLEKCGYTVFSASTGKDGLNIFNAKEISLVVLDFMLPDISGKEVLRAMRNISAVPVIKVTSRSSDFDKNAENVLGADDYIAKPFSLKILAAKIEAIHKKTDSLLIESFMKKVEKRINKYVYLTPSEMKIMSLFIKNPGRIFSRSELIECALGNVLESYDRAIDTHIKNIRRKIEDNPHRPSYLHTVHGLGYKFIESGDE